MIRRVLPIVFLLFSVTASTVLLMRYSVIVPARIDKDVFIKESLYTEGFQASYLNLLKNLEQREIDFSKQSLVEVKTKNYQATIESKPNLNQNQVRYQVKMYFQTPGLMMRPVIIVGSLVDVRPGDEQAKFEDFFWEIR